MRGAENSDVLPAELGAVAVMFCPLPTFFAGLKVKEAMPPESVLTLFLGTNVLPSSLPPRL